MVGLVCFTKNNLKWISPDLKSAVSRSGLCDQEYQADHNIHSPVAHWHHFGFVVQFSMTWTRTLVVYDWKKWTYLEDSILSTYIRFFYAAETVLWEIFYAIFLAKRMTVYFHFDGSFVMKKNCHGWLGLPGYSFCQTWLNLHIWDL